MAEKNDKPKKDVVKSGEVDCKGLRGEELTRCLEGNNKQLRSRVKAYEKQLKASQPKGVAPKKAAPKRE